MIDVTAGCPTFVANERWFLVHALSKSERKAEFHLGAQGFKTFLPQVQKTIRHARQLRTVSAPLFPCYLFVRLNLDRDRWLSVRSTVGVARLITHHDGRPAPVPRGVVEALLERCVGSLIRLDSGLVTGQRIRVLSGPFAELIGQVERLDGAGRVRLLLELMGTAVPVSVHRSAVAPAA